MADHPTTIVGLRFNDRGVDVTDAEIQATWRRAVEAERAARRQSLTQEQDADGLAERQWSQR
jgi:hypothetical protein